MQKDVLNQLLKPIRFGGLTIRYWDGEEIAYGDSPPTVCIIFKEQPKNFDLSDPVIAFGEAYMDDLVDFNGSLADLNLLIERNMDELYGGKIMSILRKRMTQISARRRNKENIQHHYDLGNEFFKLWLDPSMTYSCAYFRSPVDALEQAQRQKNRYVLRKLCLRPGYHLLDIGSGWGQLIIKAASDYGVKATGITLSQEQFVATKEKIKSLGLDAQVDVKLLDYRDLDSNNQQFDRIVSIGMLEHVGQASLPLFMDKVDQLLLPGGLALLHNITCTREAIPNTWTEKYIFPGGYIPSLRELVKLLPEHDFHLLHLESLRRHYALTLDRWQENYNRHLPEVEAQYGRRFSRMWNLYLLMSAASFRSGLEIYQMIFSKGLCEDVPLTFDFLYQGDL
ncbi:MAG TPA: SAM-dependent methyltransferase [Clostridiales bacterium]|nr:SAM-dependent methyltransferase [Clostridiales bacterium]